jgi:hypothetical protein
MMVVLQAKGAMTEHFSRWKEDNNSWDPESTVQNSVVHLFYLKQKNTIHGGGTTVGTLPNDLKDSLLIRGSN